MIKILNFNKEYLPIFLIIVFALIGLVVGVLFHSIEIFLTLFGLGISAAVVQSALVQNRIQKDNIKIQLFDKRYAVFQTVLNSVTIIRRNNWDRYLLFNDNDIFKHMIQIEENLYKSFSHRVFLTKIYV